MPYKSKFNKDEGDLYTGTRICKICNIRKPMDDFYWAEKIRVRRCKKCAGERQKQNNIRNREQKRDANFRGHIRRVYGLSIESWNKLMADQNNQCAICYKKINKQTFQIDHDHDNTYVRGLLCFVCNTALGKFHDSIPYLQSAIDYLKRTPPNIEYRSKTLSKEELKQVRSEATKLYWSSDAGKQSLKKRTLYNSGEHCASTKLSDKQVMDIIKRYKAGGITQYELAIEYKVTQALITRIMTGKARQSILKQYEEMAGRS